MPREGLKVRRAGESGPTASGDFMVKDALSARDPPRASPPNRIGARYAPTSPIRGHEKSFRPRRAHAPERNHLGAWRTIQERSRTMAETWRDFLMLGK
ncbi:hypothetical protein MTO96_010121 [Rhipicephalus appendiculatus]